MSRILRHIGNKDFKRTRQRQVDEQREIAAKKLKELQEAEEERRHVEEIARPYKSNWREETQLQENDWTPVAGSIANSTGTTFVSTADNSTLLHVTGLGGVEGTPKTATIDFGFGDTLEVPAPDFSQLGLQGYAPPLASIQRKTDQKEDERIDAEIRKLEEQIKQLTEQQNDLHEEEMSTEPEYTGWSEAEYTDKVNEINGKYSDILAPYFKNMTGKFGTGFGTASDAERKRAYAKAAELEPAHTAELNRLSAEYKSQTDAFVKARDAHYAAYDKRNLTLEAQKDVLNVQIVKLEKQRPINKQLDASQQAYPNLPMMNARVQSAVGTRQGGRSGQGGRSLGSTTQRQGGAINPSTPAPYATGISFSDLASAAKQVRQDSLARNGEAPVNPNIIGRLARSATDNIRYAPGGQMVTGLPTGRTYDPNFRSNMKLQRIVPGRNYGTPLQTMSPGEINVGRMYKDTNQLTRGTPFGKKAGDYFAQPAPTKGMRGIKNPFGSVVNRGWSGTPEIQIPKGGPQAVRASADDLARAAAKSSTKASRLLSRLIPGANAILAGADVAQRSSQGDYFGAALGGATAFPGPPGWAALALQMGYDALGRPFMGSPSTVTPTSGRGAGRSSFPTSDGNVVPRSNSANANSVGQRGSDGGMTDAQIKAAQDRANAARRAGKMSDIRGSQANKGFAPDPKTGEPRYTGMNDRQYSDATNKIADKYNKLRAPIERQYAEFSGQQAPASLMNKLNALNDAQTAEEDALAAKRAAQENSFNDALQDYNDKQDAANQARQDALDEIDNEEDPYSKLLAELGVKMEKLRREGKSVKKVELIGPGEEGYVDTTNMANSIGYNRRIIYTAAAKKLQKQILALQDAQMEWYNDRDKRREDAENADYSDAGGSSGKGGRQFGGQGGLPIGSTAIRGGAIGKSAGALPRPQNTSQSAALARQAASARMNPQQKRKRGIKESTTWSRLKKHLSEGMTTANMGAVYYSGEGHVDLATAVSDFTLSGPSGHGWNSVTKYLGSDRSKYDTIVVTVNSNSAEWEIVDGAYDVPDNLVALGKGGTGTYTVVIPRTYGALYYTARDNGSISFSTKYQRRTPLNVFVPLDDPDANAFIKDGSTDNLSRAQKKKKLEDQLKSSEKYLNGKFSEGMPKGVTQIKDYQPQQSFMDIQVGNERITKQDGRTIRDTTRGIEAQPTPKPQPTRTPTPTRQPTPTKSAVPKLYQNRSASWIAGSVSASSTQQLTDQLRGTTVSVSKLKSLSKEVDRLDKVIGLGRGSVESLQRLIDLRNNTQEKIKAEIEGGKPDLKSITQVPRSSDNQAELEKNIEASLKQLDIDNKELKGEALKRNIAVAAEIGLDILTLITLISPIPGDEVAALSAQGVKVGSKATAKKAVEKAFSKSNPSQRVKEFANKMYSSGLPRGQGTFYPGGTGPESTALRFYRNSYEPVGKVLSEKKRIKSRNSIVDKIRGYYDGKPSPLGFPVEEPPKMVNGYHPDLVDGKKVANRFNRLDPISARAMPKTGNPHIDKKVKVARNKPK